MAAGHSTQSLFPIGSELRQKRCTACKQWKPFHAFHKSKSGKLGLYQRCKPCVAAGTKARRAVKVQDDAWRRKWQGWHRTHNLRRLYGMDPVNYEAMHLAQGGVCAICGKPEKDKRRGGRGELKELAVDHDHHTGKIRSLLCARCNGGLGQFQDDPALLRAAAAYLERHAAG